MNITKIIFNAHRMSIDNYYTQGIFKKIIPDNIYYEPFYELYIELAPTTDKFDIKKVYLVHMIDNSRTNIIELSKLYDSIKNNNSNKYFFMPCVIDYGIDKGHVHQGALIYDYNKNILLFYEPYGLYKKYDKDYSVCVLDYFSKNYSSNTWHKHFSIAQGIQSILLNYNNSRADIFLTEFNTYLDQIKSGNLQLYNQINRYLSDEKKLKIRSDDMTYDVVSLMDFLYSINFSDLEKTIESSKSADLYGNYNSKCCVVITIIEVSFIDELERLYSIINNHYNKALYHILLLKYIYNNIDY